MLEVYERSIKDTGFLCSARVSRTGGISTATFSTIKNAYFFNIIEVNLGKLKAFVVQTTCYKKQQKLQTATVTKTILFINIKFDICGSVQPIPLHRRRMNIFFTVPHSQ